MMVKQAKPSPAAKLRQYLRRKYMNSDRITEDRDWKDGINQFRLRTYQDLEQIFIKLEDIYKQLNEQDND